MIVRPTMQAAVMVEPVAVPVVKELALSTLIIASVNVDPAFIIVEATTTTTERDPPNLNGTPMVILEKEVSQSLIMFFHFNYISQLATNLLLCLGGRKRKTFVGVVFSTG